jgi:methylmalonyl-CoA/ethylmalonyl-CoA epimerase
MTATDLTGVAQIGIITADLDRAIRTWQEKYGVGPWHVQTCDASTMSETMLGGRPATFGMRLAVTYLGGLMLELIQPGEGDSVYAHSLARRGGADHLHHILCTTRDFQGTIDAFGRKGVATAQSGTMNEGPIEWAYLDTEADLGFMLEFIQLPEGYTLDPPAANQAATELSK